MKNEREIRYMRLRFEQEWRLLGRKMAFPKYVDLIPETVRNIVSISRILEMLEHETSKP